MIDGCGRTIDHLRLSLTDRCNLACGYCQPARRADTAHTIDRCFAAALVRWLAGAHGLRHLRLTGGEPLLYRELLPLIAELVRIAALRDVTMTTNGQGLAARADALRRAGLTRVNVSLDTLQPDRFRRMCGGELRHTLRGIDRALDVGLHPVKLNVVVQRGHNDDEVLALARWGLARGCVVRFLEVMPIGPTAGFADRLLVPAAEILRTLRRLFQLEPAGQEAGQPSFDYRVRGDGLEGTIGMIASTTQPFCQRCRRLRITSDGWLVPCLHDDRKYALAPLWDGEQFDEIRGAVILDTALHGKPAHGPRRQSLTMVSIGG